MVWFSRFAPGRNQTVRKLLLIGLAALLATPASALTIDWVPVGNANNTADTPSTNCFAANCHGSPETPPSVIV